MMDSGDKTKLVNLQINPETFQIDEISLTDILRVLVKYKTYIYLSVLLCTAASAFYSFLVPPIYKSTAHLLVPYEYEVENLNVMVKPGKKKYGVNSVFQMFQFNLKSQLMVTKYLEKNNLSGALQDSYNFNDNLEIENVSKQYIKVSLTAPEAKYAATSLNGYIDFVSAETISLLKKNIRDEIVAQMKKVNFQINHLKENPTNTTPVSLDELSGEYIEALLETKTLKDYEREYAQLEFSLEQINADAPVKVVAIDKYAQLSNNIYRPKRTLIIIIGFLSGLMLGVLLAVTLNFVAEFRRELT